MINPDFDTQMISRDRAPRSSTSGRTNPRVAGNPAPAAPQALTPSRTPAPRHPAASRPGAAKPPCHPITHSHTDFDESLRITTGRSAGCADDLVRVCLRVPERQGLPVNTWPGTGPARLACINYAARLPLTRRWASTCARGTRRGASGRLRPCQRRPGVFTSADGRTPVKSRGSRRRRSGSPICRGIPPTG